MNTDDNEQMLARLAMQGAGLPQLRPLRFQTHGVGLLNQPTVKRVKGFDALTDKAERNRAKRAQKLAKKRG